MTIKAINSFIGEYRFLSNFYVAPVRYEGDEYPSVEHAYQAAKTTNLKQREKIRSAGSAGMAKRLGRKVTIRQEWDAIKIDVMYDLVRQKFVRSNRLAQQLMSTGDAELVEGNHWGDTFWGQCPLGEGFNHLGRILMKVRGELRG